MNTTELVLMIMCDGVLEMSSAGECGLIGVIDETGEARAADMSDLGWILVGLEQSGANVTLVMESGE